ncbi:MAG: hypothetical protein ACFFD1_00870 [Candidatus Thorarchaeota archaeon]
MVDCREFERDACKFLKRKFDKVEWLSRRAASVIDFKCYKNNNPYTIECKYLRHDDDLICLNGAQKNVDAVITNKGNGFRLIWKKDFSGNVRFVDLTIIKIRISVKEKLDKLKLIPRESYTDIIERLIKEYEKQN